MTPIDPQAAQQDSWKHQPMPDLKTQLPLHLEFTAEEFEQLTLGLIPADMDDKWFIYFEDGWLNLHRSWTGVCIYQTRIERSGDGYVTAETWVNQDDSAEEETSDSYDVALLSFLIHNFLLGHETPFPLPPDASPDSPPGLLQHVASGSGYREVQLPADDLNK